MDGFRKFSRRLGLAVGIPSLALGIWSLCSTSLFLLNSTKMEGTIEAIKTSPGPTIAVVTVKELTLPLLIPSSAERRVGEAAEIRVRTGSKIEARFNDLASLWGLPAMLLFSAAVLLGFLPADRLPDESRPAANDEQSSSSRDNEESEVESTE